MNRTICAREDRTSAAALSGTVDAEITSHAQQCSICLDILLVSEFLREDSTGAAHERPPLPNAGLIWQRAWLQANQEAVRLALRPIRFMKIIAVVAVVCSPALGWLLPIAKELLSSWSLNLDVNVSFARSIWPTTTSQVTILLGFAAATILLSLSSWYMVRQE